MATKAELEAQMAELTAQLEQKDQLIVQQGESLKALTQGSGDPAAANAELLTAQHEAEELKTQLAAQREKLLALGVGEQIEQEVRMKMRMGLPREDAIICARRQAAHDEALTKQYPNETVRREALITAASLS